MLLLSACTPPNRPVETNYHAGTDGLIFNFLEEAPPLKVYEGSEFPVVINVKNNGATDVPFSLEGKDTPDSGPVMVSLTFDPFYFALSEGQELLWADTGLEATLTDNGLTIKGLSVLGKSDRVPGGEEKLLRVASLRARSVTGQRHSPESDIYVSLCYPYKTVLATEVCIDPSKHQRNLREQACTAKDVSFSSGQGAPVSVDLVEVEMVPVGEYTNPRFIIHISNTGGGSVLKALEPGVAADQACTFQAGREGLNTIYVRATLGTVDLECKPSPVRLFGETSKFFCTVPRAELEANPSLFSRQDSFTTPLRVELYYAYTYSKKVTVEVERANIELEDSNRKGCFPWEEEVNGKCVNKCGSARKGYSCSCSENECLGLLSKDPDRCVTGDYCPPGVFCCKRIDCPDLKGEAACVERNAELGCVYCKPSKKCVSSCDECANSVENGTRCEEQEDSGGGR